MYSFKKSIIVIAGIILVVNGCKNSSSGDGNTTTLNPTTPTSSCVVLPRPEKGDVYTIRMIDYTSTPSTTVDVETTIDDFSDTSAFYSTTTRGAFSAEGLKREIYTIANNYRDITKIDTTDFESYEYYSTSTTATLEFSPYMRKPIDKVCEGTVDTSNYDINTTLPITIVGTYVGGEFAPTYSSNSVTIKIESTNEVKTIALDTYTTVKIKREDVDGTEISWIDVATGYFVAGEYYDASGDLVSTQELISHN